MKWQGKAAAGTAKGVAIGAALAFMLVGCTDAGGDAPSDNMPSPEAEQVAVVAYGDAIGTGEQVEDAVGTYEPLTLGDNAEAATLRDGSVDPGVYDAGFTDEQILAAQRHAATVLVEQFLDSEALDTGVEGYASWHEANAGALFSETVAANTSSGAAETTLILNNGYYPSIPVMVRDGAPRATNITISMDVVSAEQQEDGQSFLAFDFSYEASYRATDAGVLAMAQANTGSDEAALRSVLAPEVFDGEGENVHGMYGSVRLGVLGAEAAFQIVGASAYHYPDDSAYLIQG